ncbi:D-xylose ABC transporter periplasmic-D xylose binding protein [Pseudomonas viridiflava]|uniref:D-xylose-binding periplasmic protein n=7 Tax=Pseudomonas syringae group TaxID=136849 RepID=A0A3M4P8N2_PSEVI|nr:D-xylose ABC transporter periplasmic-D xylose binding protein [Pseudomonas viridiflava]
MRSPTTSTHKPSAVGRNCLKEWSTALSTPEARLNGRRSDILTTNLCPRRPTTFYSCTGITLHIMKCLSNNNKRTHPMNTLKRTLLASALALLSLPVMADSAHPKIGFSIDDLRLERWSRDRDYFVAAAEKLDAKVYVQSADANEQKQISQIENLISRGVDVLVIVPFNATVLTNAVAEAKKAGIKVVSYDRLILNADIDAYISFDNEKVGEMQAGGVLKAAPKGNYFLLGGAPTDNNAKILREGQMKVLQPAIDKGDIKIVGQQWVKEWNPTEALSIVENALTRNNNKIDGIVASNDATAGGAIQALAAQKLAGKVPISGQDADLAAVKRVIDGTQTMTVYKPLKLIASEAAKLSVQLVRNEKPAFTAQYDNGSKKVDTILLTPTPLTKDNIDLLEKDGFYTKAQMGGQ